MKKGFTLIELLIVVVVIAILSSIAFRLGGIGNDTTARNRTVERIQKLENALSGYYAAFGSYPPVQLEGRSRNFYYRVNQSGIQQVSHDPDSSINLSNENGWRQVEAACRAQPVSAEFPYPARYQQYIQNVSRALTEMYNTTPFDGMPDPTGTMSGKSQKADWTETQLFKFGLMSYLLPRYLIMMGHSSSTMYDTFAQWSDNNEMPSRFEDGMAYNSWNDLNEDLDKSNEKWKIALLPSQAVTARWIVNFKSSLACNLAASCYGVDLKSYDGIDNAGLSTKAPPPENKLYSAGDSQGGENSGDTQRYVLNEITMRDGWGRDLYYYSLPPYQSYRVWSAGANGRTFPPRVSPEEIRKNLSSYEKLIKTWISDDIVQMSN